MTSRILPALALTLSIGLLGACSSSGDEPKDASSSGPSASAGKGDGQAAGAELTLSKDKGAACVNVGHSPEEFTYFGVELATAKKKGVTVGDARLVNTGDIEVVDSWLSMEVVTGNTGIAPWPPSKGTKDLVEFRDKQKTIGADLAPDNSYILIMRLKVSPGKSGAGISGVSVPYIDSAGKSQVARTDDAVRFSTKKC